MSEKITTEVWYLPHCNNCDGEAYKCENCGKQFDVNQSLGRYDGAVICIEYLKNKGKHWRNRGHACSNECADELIMKRKKSKNPQPKQED